MKKRTKEILAILDEQYGREYVCYLNYETPWQLLIATMLSAQCTDARVNIVTADLFQKYDTLEKFANAVQKSWNKISNRPDSTTIRRKISLPVPEICCTGNDIFHLYCGRVTDILFQLFKSALTSPVYHIRSAVTIFYCYIRTLCTQHGCNQKAGHGVS